MTDACSAEHADWREARRVLAVRVDSLGDVLMTTPAFAAIKASTGARLRLLTSASGAEAARLAPDVDDVLVYDAPWMKATGMHAEAGADRASPSRSACCATKCGGSSTSSARSAGTRVTNGCGSCLRSKPSTEWRTCSPRSASTNAVPGLLCTREPVRRRAAIRPHVTRESCARSSANTAGCRPACFSTPQSSGRWAGSAGCAKGV